MSTDPFDIVYDYNDTAYDQLAKEAEQDNRVGDHRFLVTEVAREHWPSGDPRLKVKGNLVTANNAKADWTFSPPPPPEVISAEKQNWDQGKKRAIANAVAMVKQLADNYGVSPGKIKAGDEFLVKTNKTRIDPITGDGGFIRVVAFLTKDHAVNGEQSAAAAAPTVGF
jgi:hypothetical protein